MNNKVKELFRRYKTGEASKQERELVEAWFALHDKTPVEFNDKDRWVLNELDSRMDRLLDQRDMRGKKRPVKRLIILRYAAVWTGVLLIGTLTFLQLKKTVWRENVAYTERTNEQGAPVGYVLPDSSVVYLGAGSKLRYPENFAGKTREINLQGEAFFQVKQDASKPFILHTDDIQTRVLGTSFKADAFAGQPVVIAVATGKVSVSEGHDQQKKQLAVLTPGLKVIWNPDDRRAVMGKTDLYALEQWQAGNMVFEEQALGGIIPALQRRFGIRITIADPELAGYRVGSTFSPEESADEVLTILGTVGKFRFVAENDTSYILYKKTE